MCHLRHLYTRESQSFSHPLWLLSEHLVLSLPLNIIHAHCAHSFTKQPKDVFQHTETVYSEGSLNNILNPTLVILNAKVLVFMLKWMGFVSQNKSVVQKLYQSGISLLYLNYPSRGEKTLQCCGHKLAVYTFLPDAKNVFVGYYWLLLLLFCMAN